MCGFVWDGGLEAYSLAISMAHLLDFVVNNLICYYEVIQNK